MAGLKAFLSYSSKDKTLAGKLKRALEPFHIDVFLAHDDIEPNEKWMRTILQALKDCDLVIPLLTNNFAKSEWTEQELGYAIALDKLIIPLIPLRIDLNIYGFISQFQGISSTHPVEVIAKAIQEAAHGVDGFL